MSINLPEAMSISRYPYDDFAFVQSCFVPKAYRSINIQHAKH